MNSPAPCPAPGTPLPWVIGCSSTCGQYIETANRMHVIAETSPDHNQDFEANAAYIVHTANAYPALVAEVSALRTALAATRLMLDRCVNRLEYVTEQEDMFKSIQFNGRGARDRAIADARALLAQGQEGGAQ